MSAAEPRDRLCLEADFLHLNTETHPMLFYSSFKKITSQTWSRPTFGKVYDTLYCLTPAKTAEIGRGTWTDEGARHRRREPDGVSPA